MSAAEVWVQPRLRGLLGWTVRLTGSPGRTPYFTQRGAIAAARKLAREIRAELFICGRDGRIRERDSHGRDDPRRPG